VIPQFALYCMFHAIYYSYDLYEVAKHQAKQVTAKFQH